MVSEGSVVNEVSGRSVRGQWTVSEGSVVNEVSGRSVRG